MIIYFYFIYSKMIGKYRDIEITIDEINNYKNNYDIIENKIVVERKILNKQKEEFEIIKNLYNLENDDIYYLDRIIIDNQNLNNKIKYELEEEEKIKINKIQKDEFNNSLYNCCIFILLIILVLIIFYIIANITKK
jgi:hypothetical protein